MGLLLHEHLHALTVEYLGKARVRGGGKARREGRREGEEGGEEGGEE